MMNRRDLLKLSALAGAAVMLPAERLVTGGGLVPTARAASPTVTKFDVPLTVPPVLRPTYVTDKADIYDVTIKSATQEILPGLSTPIWGYNGTLPGPTIKARSGHPFIVRQKNTLGEPVVVHLHGGNVPASSDGHPMDTIAPGETRNYYYPNRQRAGTLFYHDHTHHQESRNTWQGLAGLYTVTDDAERNLGLPTGRYDVPLVITDRYFNDDGSFRTPNPGEFCGDVTLVNGRPHPHFKVERRPYRFRLLNVSSLDGLLDLSLSSGGVLSVIATEGGLLPAPAPVRRMWLGPSERAEAVIDFSEYPAGTQIVLKNAFTMFGGAIEIMRFDVVEATGTYKPLPSRLLRVNRLDPALATVQRDFTLRFDFNAGQMLINDKMFDPDRVDIRPKLGDTEIWTVHNGDGDFQLPHVFHTHLVQFQILDRDGAPPAPEEAGWKDSVLIPAGKSVRLIMKFGDYTGRFLYHCHMFHHADMGMMAQMEVVR